MTPYEEVRDQFEFPFELRQYQIDRVDIAAGDDRHALYWEPGSGKTAGSTHWALYHRLVNGIDQWVITMPPILLEQWKQWLESIRWKRTGEPLRVTVYDDQYAKPPRRKPRADGKPHRPLSARQKRQYLDLSADFILTSYGLFKNDYERIYTYFQGRRVGLMNDEATAIKNIESDNHGAVKDFSDGRHYMPLTGTPISKPMDGYAYVRLLTGDQIYRNKRHFEKTHVEAFDAYDRPVAYKNLDLLAENMRVQSSRILRREVQGQLPPVIHTVIPYLLADSHLELYNRIAREKLVELDHGGVIDATTAQKLRMTLQQVVVNWPYFGQDDRLRPRILDLIDETMEEIGYKKLVVVANFRMSNAYLLKQLQGYKAVAIYGDVGAKERQNALTNFLYNDECRIIILHPDSAGYGVDGLQKVCSDMLMVEAPSWPTPFHQVIARLDRDGQLEAVNCRIAIAQRTSQVRLFRNLLNNDALANSVQGGYQDLKDSIYGN